jgi:hypothetical protein
VPVIKVIAVNRDNSVTVRTANFPANQTFTATMGEMGTRGINGIVVGTPVNSGAGGTFDVSFPIPAQLHGRYQISIRLQTSHANPYYSYNWFYNNTTGSTGGVPPNTPPPQSPPVYTGIPTIRVVSVTKATSATIETHNYPANQNFTVTMGPFGTRGVNGTVVGTLSSGAGGTLTKSYPIPDALKGLDRIAIRAQTSHANPYYSYNWFWNNDANVSTAGTGAVQPTTPTTSTGYTGIPTMSITSVVANTSVTFQTHNYPPNQTFTVTEGRMGTRGINGIVVDQFNSGAGGSFSKTVPIPAELAGYSQISIRAQTSHPYPYYSYNWFFNNTTP